jgi:hypothetical protein
MSSKKVLPKGRRYTEQQREQAVRLVQLAREEGRGYAAVQRVADQLGYGVEPTTQPTPARPQLRSAPERLQHDRASQPTETRRAPPSAPPY